MSKQLTPRRRTVPAAAAIVATAIGTALGLAGGHGLAETAIPTEHRGLAVTELGVVSEASMAAQLGLEGYRLQLREITIEPGGQIARHGHETRPGLVQVLSGTWIEGHPSGETAYDPETGALVEDAETDHWFRNDGDTPATALVCDIVPAS